GDEMALLFNNSKAHQLSRPLPSEPVSIGCEAWIDVGRFSGGEKSLPAVTVEPRASQGSLTKSFAGLRRRFRRGSDEGLD
ncbi:MAG TPA: hypothetical protein VLE46_12190, partial [Nitrospira sp.]|nr:hypothetical protein [Nitrospira sp.]